MSITVQMTRRTFIRAAGLATGYALLGLHMTADAMAAALDFLGLRQKSVYEADAKVYKLRKSQDNPMIKKLYDKKKGFLSHGPCGHKSHELLHTHYHDSSAALKALKGTGVKLKL
jgi:ferredoxin hydrogenase small subunit